MAEIKLFCKSDSSDFSSKLLENEIVYCIGGSRSDIFIGTDQGRLLRFKESDKKYRLCESRQFPTKKGITSIDLASALNCLFIVCGFEFYTVALEDFKITPTLSDVSRFAVNVNPTTDDPFAVPTAFAHGRKGISVVEITERGTKKKLYYDTGMAVRNLAFSRNTICYALEHHYLALNTTTRQAIRLFQHDCPTPSIASAGPDEYLVRSSSGLTIFVNGDGTSSKPPCVLSTMKGPLFFKEPHVIHCDRSKLCVQDCFTQHAEEFAFDKIDAVNYIEGQIFLVTNGSQLFSVGETPPEETLSSLMERKEYSQAIDLLQKSLSGKHDEELVQRLAECSEMGALEEIKRANFDVATANLILCFINVKEIMEKLERHKDELGENLPLFLKSFLLYIRQDFDFASQKQIIDFELLRTCYQLKCPEELDEIDGFNPEPIGAAEILVKNNEIRRAAELLFDAHKYEDALPLFIKVGIVLDASHLRPLLFKIQKMSYQQILIPFLSLLAPFFGSEVSQILLSSGYSLLDAQYILRGLPNWAEFLEKKPRSNEVLLELAIDYIAAVESGDAKKRRKLRQLILSMESDMLGNVVVFLDSEGFIVEKLLCTAETNPEKVLEELLSVYKDYEAAEYLAARFAKSHPNVALHLLKAYLDDASHSSSVNRIGRLLAHVGSNINTEDILQKIPDSMTLHELSSFLKASVINKTEAGYVAQLSRSVTLNATEYPGKEKRNCNTRVELHDNSQCPVCSRPLTYAEQLVILPSRFIIHSKCYKNPNLCPVTNALF